MYSVSCLSLVSYCSRNAGNFDAVDFENIAPGLRAVTVFDVAAGMKAKELFL